MHQNEFDTKYLLSVNGGKLDAIAEMAADRGVPIAAFIRGAFELIIANPEIARQIEPVRAHQPSRKYSKRQQAEHAAV